MDLVEQFSNKYNLSCGNIEELFEQNLLGLGVELDKIQKRNYIIFDTNFKQLSKVYDAGMMTLLDLAMCFAEQKLYDEGHKQNKPLEFLEPEKFPDKFRYSMQSFLFTLADTLIAIRNLVKSGFNHQARIITRYFIETSELILALMIDTELYELYMTDDECEYTKWKTYFTPEKIRKRISCYENEVDPSMNFYNIRKKNYSWLSLAAHNDFLTLHLACYGRKIEQTDFFQFTGGGAITQSLEDTLDIATDTTLIFLSYITKILCEKYKLRFHYNNDKTIPYLINYEIYRRLYFEYKKINL